MIERNSSTLSDIGVTLSVNQL